MNDHPSFHGDRKSYRNDHAGFQPTVHFLRLLHTHHPSTHTDSLSNPPLPTFSPSTNPPSTHHLSPEPTNSPPTSKCPSCATSFFRSLHSHNIQCSMQKIVLHNLESQQLLEKFPSLSKINSGKESPSVCMTQYYGISLAARIDLVDA